MKTRSILYIILFFSILQFSFHSKAKDDWKLVKDKDGIKAYTRVVEGSDIKQVKVETNLKTSLSALVEVVKDVTTHKNWVYRCAKARTIKNISETEYYYYNEAEAPWPVSNRDIITHAVINQNTKTKEVTIISTGLPNYFKEIKGIVRIQKLQAKWKFNPRSDGTVDLFFYFLIDLGGDLPAWLVNLAIDEGPYETVLNMKKEVQKEKFQKIKLSFIEEL